MTKKIKITKKLHKAAHEVLQSIKQSKLRSYEPSGELLNLDGTAGQFEAARVVVTLINRRTSVDAFSEELLDKMLDLYVKDLSNERLKLLIATNPTVEGGDEIQFCVALEVGVEHEEVVEKFADDVWAEYDLQCKLFANEHGEENVAYSTLVFTCDELNHIAGRLEVGEFPDTLGKVYQGIRE